MAIIFFEHFVAVGDDVFIDINIGDGDFMVGHFGADSLADFIIVGDLDVDTGVVLNVAVRTISIWVVFVNVFRIINIININIIGIVVWAFVNVGGLLFLFLDVVV